MLRALEPQAIVCISAHYSQPKFSVTATSSPKTIHDHPVEALYSNAYPALGDTALAVKIVEHLTQAGFNSAIDPDRGLDHGAWIPLSLMFPAPQIPILQISLQQDYNPQQHFQLGQALQAFRDQGVLIVCSGGVTHNQTEFRRSYLSGGDVNSVTEWSQGFDAWVTEQIIPPPNQTQTADIMDFPSHQFYAMAHPTIEHFLPLLVAVGAADSGFVESSVTKLHSGFQHSLSTAAFWFQ